MKTNLLKSFLAIAMLGSMATNAAAEDASTDYKPLLTDGKSWLMAKCERYYDWKFDTHFMVEVKGDTIIGTIPCKHLELYFIGRESERTSLFASEQDRKIFLVHQPEGSEKTYSNLLMDFTMKVGDSKPLLEHGKEHDTVKRTVKEDKTVTAQGVNYRLLRLETTFDEIAGIRETGYWVEGIGALNTRDSEWDADILTVAPTTDDYIRRNVIMVSCFQDGKKIFDHSDFCGETYVYNEPAKILTEGKSWLIGAVRGTGYPESRYMYSVGADTIVGGKPCKIIDFYDVDKPEEKDWLIASEINGRLFKVADEYHAREEEVPGTFQPVLDLTYPALDYMLHAYDFRTGLPCNPEGDGEFHFDTGVRSYHQLNHSVLPARRETVVRTDYVYDYVCWVEGIGGSIVDFSLTLFPTYASIGSIVYRYMIECYQDGESIFTQNDFTRPVAGIEEVRTEPAAADGAIYDLQGRRLAKPAPGQLYIRDGRLHRN